MPVHCLNQFPWFVLVIDVFARYTIGRKVSSPVRADFVLDTLEQALLVHQPTSMSMLTQHRVQPYKWGDILAAR